MFATLQAKLIAGGIVLLLLAGAVFTVYQKGYSAGHETGQADGARTQLETDRQQYEADRKQFLDKMAAYDAKDQAQKQIIAAQDAQLDALRHSRIISQATVAKLPDAALANDIRTKIGSVPSDTPFTIDEQRKIDVIVTDYPNVTAQNELLNKKIDALALRVDNIEQQKNAAVDAYNKLVPLYAKAYNAAQRKHSKFVKIITFGLVKDRKLDLPAPVSLEHP